MGGWVDIHIYIQREIIRMSNNKHLTEKRKMEEEKLQVCIHQKTASVFLWD